MSPPGCDKSVRLRRKIIARVARHLDALQRAHQQCGHVGFGGAVPEGECRAAGERVVVVGLGPAGLGPDPGPGTCLRSLTRAPDGYALHGDLPTGNKRTRAQPVAARAEAGGVAPIAAPWNNTFLDEAEIFPDGPHDNQIDALAGAVAYLADERPYDYGDLSGLAEIIDDLTRPSPYSFDTYDDRPTPAW